MQELHQLQWASPLCLCMQGSFILGLFSTCLLSQNSSNRIAEMHSLILRVLLFSLKPAKDWSTACLDLSRLQYIASILGTCINRAMYKLRLLYYSCNVQIQAVLKTVGTQDNLADFSEWDNDWRQLYGNKHGLDIWIERPLNHLLLNLEWTAKGTLCCSVSHKCCLTE